MAKKNTRTPAGKPAGAQLPSDARRFLPCGGGAYAYLTTGASSPHRKVTDLVPAIDAWLEIATGANEREILAAQAAELDAAYPGNGWDAIVAYLTAEPVAA